MFLNRFSFLEIAKTFVDSELGVSGHSGVTGSGGSIVLDQHWQWISASSTGQSDASPLLRQLALIRSFEKKPKIHENGAKA